MANVTPKDKCFDQAVKDYQELYKKSTGKELPYKIHTQRTWAKDFEHGGKWEMLPKGVNAYQHARRWASKHLGFGDYQIRYPDITIEQDGCLRILDNKFTRNDGSIDQWGRKRGADSPYDQENDYKDINRDNGFDTDDPQINENTCKCQDRGTPEPYNVPVQVPASEMSMYYGTLPGGIGSKLPTELPQGIRIPTRIPIRIPIPVP